MIIEIAKIPVDGTTYQGEDPSSILGVESDPQVRASGPIRYDLLAQFVSNELIIKGTLSVEVSFECSRCTEFYSTRVGDSSFLRAYELSKNVESVDLADDIREAILLSFPHFPLCSEDCKGLCPHCGTNLNQGGCECKPPPEVDPWAGLGRLKLK